MIHQNNRFTGIDIFQDLIQGFSVFPCKSLLSPVLPSNKVKVVVDKDTFISEYYYVMISEVFYGFLNSAYVFMITGNGINTKRSLNGFKQFPKILPYNRGNILIQYITGKKNHIGEEGVDLIYNIF